MSGPVALLYDVHGNLPALEAVLADARAAGATAAVFGGDAAAFGAWPAETVAALEDIELPTTWLRGNWDRWLATHPADDLPENEVVRGAAEAALEALDADRVARLGGLPTEVVISGVRCVHAGPGDDMAAVAPAVDDGDAGLAAAVRERRLVVGHTHLQFARQVESDGRVLEIVNPGSVGLPFDGDTRAAYALLDLDRDAVELRRVAYDHAASAQALRALGAGWAEVVADRIERAAP